MAHRGGGGGTERAAAVACRGQRWHGGTRRGVKTMGRGVSNLGQVQEDVGLHHVPDSFLNVVVPETWGQRRGFNKIRVLMA